MTELSEVQAILGDVLGLGDRAPQLNKEDGLLGVVPELDSMALVAVLAEIERRLGVTIRDDEVSAELFATVGDLAAFLKHKRSTANHSISADH